MKAKFVNEVKSVEDNWANKEITKWFKKQPYEYLKNKNVSEIAKWVVLNWEDFTNTPKEDMYEEGLFPDKIEELIYHFNLDYSEFSDYFGEWVDAELSGVDINKEDEL